MSASWAKGSTRRWRRIRAQVLARDGHRCQLRLNGCTTIATCAHHVAGRAVTGDDPQFIVASCEWCNLSTGEPGREVDPTPTKRTSW